MRLIAQRARVIPTGPEGINAFAYWHGGLYWDTSPPSEAPVVAGATILAVDTSLGAENTVLRSWLQVTGPDSTSPVAFWQGINDFADALANIGGQLPKTGRFGRVTVAFEVIDELVAHWWDELLALATAAVTVGPGTRRWP